MDPISTRKAAVMWRWTATATLALGLTTGVAAIAAAQRTAAGPSGPDAIVAMVEVSPITKRTVARAYAQRLQTYAPKGPVDLLAVKLLGLERFVLQDLVNREVALLEAHRLGLDATPDEARALLPTLPVFLEHGRYVGEARVDEILGRQQPALTRAAFLEEIRRGLAIERLDAHVTRGAGARRPQVYAAFIERARSLLRVTVDTALLSQIVREAR